MRLCVLFRVYFGVPKNNLLDYFDSISDVHNCLTSNLFHPSLRYLYIIFLLLFLLNLHNRYLFLLSLMGEMSILRNLTSVFWNHGVCQKNPIALSGFFWPHKNNYYFKKLLLCKFLLFHFTQNCAKHLILVVILKNKIYKSFVYL